MVASFNILNVKTNTTQVARNVVQCNIPDHATPILKIELCNSAFSSTNQFDGATCHIECEATDSDGDLNFVCAE